MIRPPYLLRTLLATVCLSGLSRAAEVPVLDCLIEPEMSIELSSAHDGVIEQVMVDVSDVVRRDQSLVLLESSMEQASLELARAQFARQDLVHSREVQLKFAERKKVQFESLYKRKAVSAYERDEVNTEAKLAQLALLEARNERQIAGIELQQAEARLKLRTLRSPIDGVVVERYLHPGESVDEKAVLRLAQIDPLRIHIIVPNEYFGTIEPGMSAKVTAEGPARNNYLARVSAVDRIIDAASGTFSVRLSLPNPEHNILSGVRCQAEFSGTELARQ